MSLTALAAGIGAAGNLASTGLQFLANKHLQEDAQSFNAQEAQLARDFSAQEAANARAFNAEQAQLARDFESNKYQRTVADMKAAGINPASIGMTPPSGGSPMASSAAGVSSPAASSGAGSISSPNLGNILSSAFDSAMVQSMKDKRFAESLIERTAYHANLIDKRLKHKDPEWLKDYARNPDKGVVDL